MTLEITPYTGYGYELDEIRVYRAGSPNITVALNGTGNTRTFIMPASNVMVTATFKLKGHDVATSLIANARYTVRQEKAVTQDALRLWLSDTINYLIRATGVVIAPANITITNFLPAVAGDAINLSGTNGTFAFRVTHSNFPNFVSAGGVITATRYDPVGNDDIEGEHTGSPLRTWTQGSMLYVGGLTVGEMLYIHNMYGQLIYQMNAVGDEAKIPLLARGMYVISNGNARLKIVF